MAHMRAAVAPRSKQISLTELTDERSGNRVRAASWEYEPDAGRPSVFAGPYNVRRLSCTAKAHVPKPERRGGCRRGVAKPRLANCNRRDVAHILDDAAGSAGGPEAGP
jgi:hypothetical protein